jgi:hypothetical protein
MLAFANQECSVDKEVIAARSAAGDILEERIEEHKEKYVETRLPPPPPPVTIPAPPPAPAPVVVPPPEFVPAPVIVEAGPYRVGHVDIVDKTVIRESSPSRSSSSWDSGHHHHHRHHHHHHEDGTLVVVPSRSRSRSRTRRDIRAEIKALERELVHRPRGDVEREVVRTERLPDGQLVVYEEEVERIVAHPKPARIEKDKRGRLSISVPKYR